MPPNANITLDQNQAIEMVLTSLIRLLAYKVTGTGKAAMLKTLANEAHDMMVIGLAPSKTSTHVLMWENELKIKRPLFIFTVEKVFDVAW